jgi:hypothetical protein
MLTVQELEAQLKELRTAKADELREEIAQRIGLEVGESKDVELQGRPYKMTRTQ